MKRRFFLKLAAVLPLAECASSAAPVRLQTVPAAAKKDGGGDARIRGPFPLLCTPYTETGAVDYEVLAKEARFVDACGVSGIIWPPADDALRLLTLDEERKGLETLARTMANGKAMLTVCCPGRTTEEALARARATEELSAEHRVRSAILARPPDDAKTQADLEKYYTALARTVRRPVIIQTTNGKSPQLDVELLIRLAKSFPETFGYVKEESEGVKGNDRIRALVAAKPVIHNVFSAWGGWAWLYQGRRLGTGGLITQRPMYADVLAYIWEQMENGDANGTLTDAFAKLLLMLNLKQVIPGHDLRGYHLYILQKRGVFKNRLSRVAGKGKSGQWTLSDQKLTPPEIDEIETCYAALKPYLKDVS
jgi:dihydrodipicolinate synthase/N-acetylneuraminate lyase